MAANTKLLTAMTMPIPSSGRVSFFQRIFEPIPIAINNSHVKGTNNALK